MSLSTNYFMIASCLVKKRYISFLAGLMGSWCCEMEIPTAFFLLQKENSFSITISTLGR
jgi:hypothetical protein